MDGDVTALSTHSRDGIGAPNDSGQPGAAMDGFPNGSSAPDEMAAVPPTQTLAPSEPGMDRSPLSAAGTNDDAPDTAIAADERLGAAPEVHDARRDEAQPHAVRHHGQMFAPPRAPGAPAPSLHDRVAFERWLRGDSLADLPALPAMPPDSTSTAALPPPQLWSQPPAVGATSAPLASPAPHDSGRARATLPHFAQRDAPHSLPPASGPAHGDHQAGSRVPHTTLQLSPLESNWAPRRVGTLPAPTAPALGAVDRRRLASGDRRIFLAAVACALVLLALAGQVVWSRSLGITGTSHSVATVASPSAPPAQIATPSPAATEPATTPTATAPRSTPRPAPTRAPTRAPSSAPAHSGAVYPLVSALRLSCGPPGVALPLRNPSTVVRSWSIPLPPGVVANGWTGTVSGTVAPGGKLTLFLWQAAGSQAGSRELTVNSAGQQSAVRLSLSNC